MRMRLLAVKHMWEFLDTIQHDFISKMWREKEMAVHEELNSMVIYLTNIWIAAIGGKTHVELNHAVVVPIITFLKHQFSSKSVLIREDQIRPDLIWFDLMGYIIVISLPMVLLFLIAAIGCYLFGKNRGRREASIPQYYGPPAPAPPYGVQQTPPKQ
ncbi:hypothetical protein QVD17_36315 [Tagetes erecta]|uniref:Uncharacterized protein n=1 Tax=Tagetes erecta TaxID=13708 RepID=A0AAD8NIX1_TARER|nr:hypothetical protein QVD17_36315 [Tagetes erecta]